VISLIVDRKNVILDEEGVVVGAHEALILQHPLDGLEEEVYLYLKDKGSAPLSTMWRRFNCHLWELSHVLKALKEKGLVQEFDPDEAHYRRDNGEFEDAEAIGGSA